MLTCMSKDAVFSCYLHLLNSHQRLLTLLSGFGFDQVFHSDMNELDSKAIEVTIQSIYRQLVYHSTLYH